MSDQEEKTSGEQPSADENYVNSVNMAFNMGVATNQQTAKQPLSVVEVAAHMGEQIFQNMSQAYGSDADEDQLRANTEYFLQIALMGYIVPNICAFEPDFKNKLFDLIFKKSQQDQEKRGPAGGGSSIIT